MIVCGIELASSEARLIVLSGTKDNYLLIKTSPPKIILGDDENPDEVKAFKNAIDAFFREYHVEKIAIKKRNKKGEYSGGPLSFKMEGLIQLYPNCRIVLISPQSISAAKRNFSPNYPENINKYQHVAFDTAFTALE